MKKRTLKNKYAILNLILSVFLIVCSCKTKEENKTDETIEEIQKNSSIEVNKKPDNNPISELNNAIIFKQDKCDYNSKIDTTVLFKSWAMDLNDPSASFEITKDSFYAVDFDGIGVRSYILKGRNIKISDENYTDEGEITKLTQDSLHVKWKATQITMKYIKWIDN
ncbi:hypothetical protein ACFS5J_01690 [Flavobacterium chuncheonense]|uniref:Lipoprotein n=1 Tax=Flavobacterium chuncheonense TaxID=2026653 RepID=A0ABW5YIB8_9FLAO